ncbi:E3 ubiquitin-protein ligase SIRP1-like [Lingula anatina]|uniref:E3 ubiquitin-protein ligase SIRP1-like n=1 Tax=Lingula anatina TaxID=7574 RepID=A0A1S3H4H8_LINAN|nr:E3 ubiquitin-protein ligase SIRP1-like [Lingula anatina]|eukprot:XP_013380371.1 E3 ubiquitin-protein ligase SIRP1-like [Lingula anatina]
MIKCSICLDTIPQGALATIPCGHVFHAECLSEGLEKNQKCPICRRTTTPSEIIKLYLSGGEENEADDSQQPDPDNGELKVEKSTAPDVTPCTQRVSLNQAIWLGGTAVDPQQQFPVTLGQALWLYSTSHPQSTVVLDE